MGTARAAGGEEHPEGDEPSQPGLHAEPEGDYSAADVLPRGGHGERALPRHRGEVL